MTDIPTRNAQIVSARRSGTTAAELARRFGVHVRTINRIAAEAKAEIKDDETARTMARYRVLCDAYEAGMTQREVAEQYGCSKREVCVAMKTLDMRPRTPEPPGRNQEDYDAMNAAHCEALVAAGVWFGAEAATLPAADSLRNADQAAAEPFRQGQ